MSKEEEEEVNLSVNVNGESNSKVPPGFRFHPTEEELLHYYLRKKVACEKIDLDVILEVDLNKLEPWDIQDKCKIGSTPQNDWYFFSHKDKKYPSGTRTNRATAAGFWKATGRDKVIHSSRQRIGMRKTLVFYKGRAPRGQKSDWIMHEYRLHDHNLIQGSNNWCDSAHEEGWVVCRVFKKKNFHKCLEIPQISKSDSIDTRAHDQLQSLNQDDDFLEELLTDDMDHSKYSCKLETDNFTTTHDVNVMQQFMNPINNIFDYSTQCSSNWADVDKFVAYQLDSQMGETNNLSSCYEELINQKLCFSVDDHNDFSRPNELDIWSLARSSMEPLYHLSL